jgi:hypothetical protein
VKVSELVVAIFELAKNGEGPFGGLFGLRVLFVDDSALDYEALVPWFKRNRGSSLEVKCAEPV